MTVTAAEWVDADRTTIKAEIDGVVRYVPDDPGNRFRQLIAEEWEGAGNTIVEYVAPPEPLPSLVPYQFFAMLELSGHKAELDAYVDGLPSPANVIARAKLDHTLEFRRDNDLVLAAQQALSLTDQELDALWAQAAAIQ